MNHLVQQFLKAKTAEEMKALLSCLMTEKEVEEMRQRILILQMLVAGIPHHAIAQKLAVGVATVTRGAKVVKSSSFQKIQALL